MLLGCVQGGQAAMFFPALPIPAAARAAQPSDMSFALSMDGGRLEWGSHNLDTVFAQRSNIANPAFLRRGARLPVSSRRQLAPRAAGLGLLLASSEQVVSPPSRPFLARCSMIRDVIRFGRESPEVLRPENDAEVRPKRRCTHQLPLLRPAPCGRGIHRSAVTGHRRTALPSRSLFAIPPMRRPAPPSPAVCAYDARPVPVAARLLGRLPRPLRGPHVRRGVERAQRAGGCWLTQGAGARGCGCSACGCRRPAHPLHACSAAASGHSFPPPAGSGCAWGRSGTPAAPRPRNRQQRNQLDVCPCCSGSWFCSGVPAPQLFAVSSSTVVVALNPRRRCWTSRCAR